MAAHSAALFAGGSIAARAFSDEAMAATPLDCKAGGATTSSAHRPWIRNPYR
jgi:hypothetical protein